MADLEFIDNQDDNTMARALRSAFGLGKVHETGKSNRSPSHVRIATAFFSPEGFSHIAEVLERVQEVRLLLGADFAVSTNAEQKLLEETSEEFERRCVERGLSRISTRLAKDRDRLQFNRSNSMALRKLVASLRNGNMEVRRFEQDFLHAKAYIFTHADKNDGLDGIIAGSSNLTSAGLIRNIELNLGRSDKHIVNEAVSWFDNLWVQSSPFDLAELYEEVFKSRTPWEIFVRVLWLLYGHEIDKDSEDKDGLPLTNFQRHGVIRAKRLIQENGGAIVADEVGLGKTFIAGEILRMYQKNRQRALLVCPASLRDSTWDKFIHQHQLYAEYMSFEQLAADVQLKEPENKSEAKKHIKQPLEEYQLVIVDEAHNYRNPDAPTRAKTLQKLLRGQRRDLLLLTATPVNNSLWDLFYLIRFFIPQDAFLAKKGILSIKNLFLNAAQDDPTSLNPDVLYPVIDATTVKRTRQFVKKHYSGDKIKDAEGNEHFITFPNPVAISVKYPMEELLPGFFDLLEQTMDPDHEDSVTFARYMPDDFLLNDDDAEETARNKALLGLLRSGILKRFESSIDAFRKTITKMVSEHERFLRALNKGYVVSTAFMKEFSADDEAAFEDLSAGTEHRIKASCYDVKRLYAEVERDKELLSNLVTKADKIQPSDDPKLAAFVKELVKIAKEASKEASTPEEERQNRKVLVFTHFEHTAEWIGQYLREVINEDHELACYQERIAVVSGSGDLDEVSRQQAVEGFAPKSTGTTDQNDNFDLLISTDVLAEGVNLQQCRHIINFDIPWNPMRLVQRHGRIDRISSPHSKVFLRTIFPADRLDSLLNLEQRILNKLAMASASVGVVAPIEKSSHGKQVFSETRAEIEKLLKEDSSLYERGGTVGAAQTGEEYRQTLRNAIRDSRNKIVNMPWKVGSGMVNGTRRGMFFCAVVGRESEYERTYLRFVNAGNDWLPEKIEGGAFDIERELGTCLRLIECEQETTSWFPDSLQDRVYDFWEIARKDVYDFWMRETDPSYLLPQVSKINHSVAAFIRENMPTDYPEHEINKALDILESPWPRREENLLRAWFKSEKSTDKDLSRYIIKNILETGLEPVISPSPLPPIEVGDVELYCWLGIEKES